MNLNIFNQNHSDVEYLVLNEETIHKDGQTRSATKITINYKKIAFIVMIPVLIMGSLIIALLIANSNSSSAIKSLEEKTKISQFIKNETFEFNTNQNSTINPKNFCVTESCLDISTKILDKLDFNVKPCDNFYRFSCGNYLDQIEIPKNIETDEFLSFDDKIIEAFANSLEKNISLNDTSYVNNAKRFHRSCLNTEKEVNKTENQFKQFLIDEFGGWKLIGQEITLKKNLTEQMINFHKLNHNPLYDINIKTVPNLGLVQINVHKPTWFNEKNLEDYKEFVTQIVKLMNSTLNATEQIDSMIKLESSFSWFLNEEEFYDDEMTIASLNEHTPEFNWTEFIKHGILSEHQELNVTENNYIEVYDLNYILRISEIYSSKNQNEKNNLNNLLIWSFVLKQIKRQYQDNINYLPQSYIDAYSKFIGTNLKKKQSYKPTRSVSCAKKIVKIMLHGLVDHLDISDLIKNGTTERFREMVEILKNEFESLVNETNWMDEKTKLSLIKKIGNINELIDYFQATRNDTHNDLYYKEYKFNETDYFFNKMTTLRLNAKQSISNIIHNIEYDYLEKYMPIFANTLYMHENDKIFVPMTFFQSPFFDPVLPNYLNFGGIGFLLAQTFVHGLWSELNEKEVFFQKNATKTVKKFQNKFQCFIDQYSNYNVEQINTQLNGRKTFFENTADNIAIKLSFNTYQKWLEKNPRDLLLPQVNYSQNQLFFINFAQIHCKKYSDYQLKLASEYGDYSPSDIRVFGSTSNSIEFAKAFNCKKNQPNNPEKKCSFF